MTASDARPARPEPLWRDLLGEHLRETRQQRGDTLRSVARRANLSIQYLSEIERGRKEASSEVIGAVADALGLTLLDLTLGVAGRLHDARSTAAPTRDTVALAA
jgi:transcriptional regulator with XRE-family HTH domain